MEINNGFFFYYMEIYQNIQILGFNQSVLNVDEIEDYIIAEFGKDFFRSNDKYSKIYATSIWFADQSLISYKLDAWTKKYIFPLIIKLFERHF